MSLPASPTLPILPAMLISTQSCMHLMSYVLSCLRPCVHQGTSQMPMGQIVCAKFSGGWLFMISGCWGAGTGSTVQLAGNGCSLCETAGQVQLLDCGPPERAPTPL